MNGFFPLVGTSPRLPHGLEQDVSENTECKISLDARSLKSILLCPFRSEPLDAESAVENPVVVKLSLGRSAESDTERIRKREETTAELRSQ